MSYAWDMNKLAAFSVGFVGAWLVYEALTRNPLWYTQYKRTPESIPEWMVRQARFQGHM